VSLVTLNEVLGELAWRQAIVFVEKIDGKADKIYDFF
jgi:hypothetical protein